MGKGSGFTMHLLRAESPGPDVGKLVPKMRKTATILYMIYVVMTVFNVIFLLCGGMSPLEALCTAFGTAGTGGFGVKADSCASYSPYCIWVITIFMLLFGVNFNFYYFLTMKRIREAFRIEEVRWYAIIVIAATGVCFVALMDEFGAFEALTHAAFQVATLITTTG